MSNCENLHIESMKNNTDKTKIYDNWVIIMIIMLNL